MAQADPGRRRRAAAGLVSLAAALVCLSAGSAAQAARVIYTTGFNSSTVAAFGIGANGSLTQLPGSPYGAASKLNGVALTPDGHHLYVARYSAPSAILGFDVAADGSLTQMAASPFAGVVSPVGIAVAPDGRHLYAANLGSTNVSAFEIGAGGGLTPVAGSPFATGAATAPISVAMAADGAHLYAANYSSKSVSGFDVAADGSLSPVTGSPFGSGGDSTRSLTLAPDGRFLYASNQGTNTISGFAIATNGALAKVPGSPLATSPLPAGLAIAPDGGHLYAAGVLNDVISTYAIGADGALSALGEPVAAGIDPIGLTATPAGRGLYAANNGSSDISAFGVDGGGLLSGISGSPFGPAPTNPDSSGIAASPDQGPTAALAEPGQSGSRRTFDATGSTDPDGTVARYDWSFGDGTTSPNAGPAVSHEFSTAGDYKVSVIVSDNEGCSIFPIYTGQSMLCNGGPAAIAMQQISIPRGGDGPNGGGSGLGLRAKARRRQRLDSAVEITVGCAQPCLVRAGGRLLGSRLRSAKVRLAAGAHKRLRLGVTPDALARGRQALDDGRPVRASIHVSATGGGERASRDLTVRFSPARLRARD